MKRITKITFCITAIIIISILFCLTSFADNAVVTEYKSESANDIIYTALSQYLDDEEIIAGIMGYFQRESKMRSDAIAGWPDRDSEKYNIDSSKDFTAKVDMGLKDGSTKEYFVEEVSCHLGGYGLGQWMNEKYVSALYDFAQEWGTSIGDAEMQSAFMAWSIQHQTPKLWKQIQNENNVWIIGRKIGHLYDGTNSLGSETIASFAQEYYKKYGTK